MKRYEICNARNEVVAVIFKFSDGRCVVHYTQTVFDSMEQINQLLNSEIYLREIH